MFRGIGDALWEILVVMLRQFQFDIYLIKYIGSTYKYYKDHQLISKNIEMGKNRRSNV